GGDGGKSGRAETLAGDERQHLKVLEIPGDELKAVVRDHHPFEAELLQVRPTLGHRLDPGLGPAAPVAGHQVEIGEVGLPLDRGRPHLRESPDRRGRLHRIAVPNEYPPPRPPLDPVPPAAHERRRVPVGIRREEREHVLPHLVGHVSINRSGPSGVFSGGGVLIHESRKGLADWTVKMRAVIGGQRKRGKALGESFFCFPWTTRGRCVTIRAVGPTYSFEHGTLLTGVGRSTHRVTRSSLRRDNSAPDPSNPTPCNKSDGSDAAVTVSRKFSSHRRRSGVFKRRAHPCDRIIRRSTSLNCPPVHVTTSPNESTVAGALCAQFRPRWSKRGRCLDDVSGASSGARL
ncbi:hypothetical protein BHM03_00061492, partial [Ensete ventricosum]